MEKFFIVKDTTRNVRRFNLQGRNLEFKLRPVPPGEEPVGWIKGAINQIIARGTEGLKPEDQVAFSFCSKEFKRGDGWVRFRSAKEVTYADVWSVISNIYQSNSLGLNTETFCLGVTSVRMPAGKGKGRRYNTFNEECSMRRGIISIKNKDNLCLPRALVVALAYAMNDSEQVKIRKDIGKLQTLRAQELLRAAAVIIPEEGAGIPELQQFQQHLSNYKIVAYQYGSKGRDLIFKGVAEGPTLNLLYHEGHYNVIISLTATFCCGYYCEDCNVPYNVKDKHRCGGTCPACQQPPACPLEIRVMCSDCQRSFRGQQCYENHLKDVCKQIRRCDQCFKVVKTDRTHTCGEIYCKICSTHVPANHLCYMQLDCGRPKTENTLFVFYDLETRQEKAQQDGSLLHEPNLCVLASRCDVCIGERALYFCQKCGYRLVVYREEPVVNLMKYVLAARKKFKQVVVIAHNGQAFDHQFCLNYILTRTDLNPNLIMRGTKIVMMAVDNVKFLDSLNYFPMALSKLPKAFGLGDGFRKGYFPHLFNTTANAKYVGPLPAIEFYDPDNMKAENRVKFLAWHEEHKNDTFNMQRDLVDYCISDVEILTAACLKFRQQLMHTGNVCPFTEACTIASTCNKVYRRNFLKPTTIGIIPKGGYRWRDNQSKIAIQWLVWVENLHKINIQHTAKQQEAIVGGVKVDGYCVETYQVFEFHGCYYHGCATCFKHNRDVPLQDDPTQTLNVRYEATVAKTDRLKSLGYDVTEMWECEFKKQIQENEELRIFTENHPLVLNTPLNPRDAFYGGRTGNTSEYYKCRPGEKIKYVDVCSLYPWVCKYGKFPIGHPRVYIGQECNSLNLRATNGLIKCKIIPPTDLYHPVLPTKVNNKLMFTLCRTCGEEMNQNDCLHSDEQRALTGVWVVDEVVKAIDTGYLVNEILEVWSYDVEQYNKTANVDGLFTEMMNKFIKVKQQATGWPSQCTTKEERDRYIEEFLEKENVKLEFTEIVENPGLRSLAKLILNSFWGKLGQRENQPKTIIIRSPEELFDMLSNPSINVNSVLPINEDVLVVNWEHKEEAYDPLATVNVVIAAYVTTQARLKLYSYLEQLGERVLYYDTDSVIYISRNGDKDVSTGEFLGDMTDELKCYGPGSYITEFVSGGPKNYAFKLSTETGEERVVCKVKGISLNHTASQLVSFDSIKSMVLEASADSVCVVSKNILRTKKHEVVTVQQTKLYRPNSTKRRFLDDHCSVPYGFKRHKT